MTYSSTYVLVALSIDRYDAITHPMNFSGSCESPYIFKTGENNALVSLLAVDIKLELSTCLVNTDVVEIGQLCVPQVMLIYHSRFEVIILSSKLK